MARRRDTRGDRSERREEPPPPEWLQTSGDDLRLEVIVAPRASRTRIMGIHDNRLKIQLAAPPAEGQANKALVRFVSELLDVPSAQVEIVGGASSTRKSLRLYGVPVHHALLRLTPKRGV